jgi:hypothetical protein
VRRNLVILLLIVSSLSVLGVTYWFFRPGKANAQVETVQTAEPLRQEAKSPQAKPQPQPVASKEITVPKMDEKKSESMVVEQKTVEDPATTSEALAQASVPKMVQMPLPEDPILADLLKVRDGKPLVNAKPLAMSVGSLGVRGQLASTETSETATIDQVDTPASTKAATEPLATEVTKPSLAEKSTQDTQATANQDGETVSANIPEIAKENSPEMVLSISFFDRQWEDFSKGIKASLDLTGTVDSFMFGGSLELGMIYEDTNRIYVSLLGKAIWTLGKGTVTFPLSIAMGPTLFYDQTNSITWGLSAEAMAGIRYMLTDSFSLFASTGITYQLEIASFESHWILQPLQLGVGFRF